MFVSCQWMRVVWPNLLTFWNKEKSPGLFVSNLSQSQLSWVVLSSESPCKIVSSGSWTLTLFCSCQNFVHSDPHQLVSKLVRLRDPSVFAHEFYWRSVPKVELCVWILPGVCCSYFHWLQGLHLVLHHCDWSGHDPNHGIFMPCIFVYPCLKAIGHSSYMEFSQ